MIKPDKSFRDYCKDRYEEGPEENRSGWLDFIKRTDPTLYEEIEKKEGSHND